MSDGKPPRLTEVPAFTEYIAQGWDSPVREPQLVPGAAGAAAAHRARLAEALPGRTVVVAAGHAPTRSNDTAYDFRADSDFYWLTGCAVEHAVAVVGDGAATLYLPPPARPGDIGFFADAAYGELWVGPSPSLAAWSAALGVKVAPLADFPGPPPGELPEDVGRVLAELRMIKDEWEIAQLREAVDRTVEGFAAVLAELPAAIGGGGERWLQGTFDRYARTHGNGPGYASIVGAGPHAPTLHWVRCDGPVNEGEVLLLDMGVETRSHYTADVTRTFPVSGAFTPVQRQVHDLVERAHRAGMAQVRPGRPFTAFHHAAMEVIARGLHDWGLLPVSVDEALSDAGQHHRRYLICGIGHHLGLDVHDCARSRPESYHGARMTPGMALTVEPGLYFHAHDRTVPPELRGIGVRIEDDLLVTADGAEVLSAALPIDASGLENWTKEKNV
ncbi:aminopeptidase P family protein [Nonomuraea sp. MG754425]|uniref:aminopeptidase P family protein n=1 Tax=Nonomuraea sp. MG754425 TaxID=2570319 RepID=UPI001F28F7C2|nr:aminopeptidase P family protein [Nonomuraea sp. MG754425]MCF6473079.1 aminopeptidase P family protein [Nonomuraea sp. MG754425]